MTGDRHRETPVAVRFSEDRQRLEDFARDEGKPVHRVVRDAVRAWLDKHAKNGNTERLKAHAQIYEEGGKR